MAITTEQLCDKVIDHLKGMEERSGDYNDKGLFECKYRDSRGNMCAIGCLKEH